MAWRHLAQAEPGWWAAVKAVAETGGPWGILGLFSWGGARMMFAQLQAGNEMRQHGYQDELSRMEAERKETAATIAALREETRSLRSDLDAAYARIRELS